MHFPKLFEGRFEVLMQDVLDDGIAHWARCEECLKGDVQGFRGRFSGAVLAGSERDRYLTDVRPG
jgi:hypothetical protein